MFQKNIDTNNCMIYTDFVMKGEMCMNIKMKKIVKEGFWLVLIYTFITLCLFMATDRIERLDYAEENFRNTNSSVSVNFGK